MIHQILGSDGLPFWIPEEITPVTAAIRPGHWWEPELLPLFDRYCRGDVWTIEVGAYLGDHTIAIARRGPVIAFEPQALPWALLGLNLALRQTAYPWLTQRMALYSRPVTFDLAPGWGPADHPSSAFAVVESGDFPAAPLDDLSLPLHVGFLKIDAQGCDLHVLRGAECLIERDRPVILCEFYKDLAVLHGDTWETHQRWFAEHDYELRPVSSGSDNYLGVPLL